MAYMLQMAVRGSSQSLSRCLQVSSAPFLARLQVISLSPFVPGVDEQQRFLIAAGPEFRDRRFEGTAKRSRGAIHNNHSVLAPARCIVPTYKYAGNRREWPDVRGHSLARIFIVVHLEVAAEHSQPKIPLKSSQAELIVECRRENSKLGRKFECGVEPVAPKIPARLMRIDGDQVWILIAILRTNITKCVG